MYYSCTKCPGGLVPISVGVPHTHLIHYPSLLFSYPPGLPTLLWVGRNILNQLNHTLPYEISPRMAFSSLDIHIIQKAKHSIYFTFLLHTHFLRLSHIINVACPSQLIISCPSQLMMECLLASFSCNRSFLYLFKLTSFMLRSGNLAMGTNFCRYASHFTIAVGLYFDQCCNSPRCKSFLIAA